MKPQTWLITGATGLVGRALTVHLVSLGQDVRTLGRSTQTLPGTTSFSWNVTQGHLPLEALEGVDVVVHLAAASVGQRWTSGHRKAILDSRVQGTQLLRQSLLDSNFQGTWIQASAVGLYGNTSSPCHESTPAGSGFLADVAQAWERAIGPSEDRPFRVVTMRLGLVLSPKGGTLEKLLPIYRFGLGAPLGSGEQGMAWIHIDDVVAFTLWAAQHPQAEGPFNVVAPHSVNNATFSSTLAKALNRPHWAPSVPGFALRLAMGDMASLLLEGQIVVPQRLNEAGFEWQHPELQGALESCVG